MYSVLVCYFMLTIRCPTSKEKRRPIKHVLNKLAPSNRERGQKLPCLQFVSQDMGLNIIHLEN